MHIAVENQITKKTKTELLEQVIRRAFDGSANILKRKNFGRPQQPVCN